MKAAAKAAQVPKLRFPRFTDEWVASNLGAVTTYTKGFAFKSEDYRASGIRIVRVSDLAARHIKENNDNIYIDSARRGEFQKWAIRGSEIVITTVGSRPELVDSAVGRGIFVDCDSVGFLNQNMLKLRSVDGNAPSFIFGQINTPEYVEFISQIKRGNANQANITVQDLMKYEVFVTNSAEQQKIAAFLTAVDGRIEQLSRKKALLEATKKGVMQQLFTQTLRFQDDHCHDFPDWEEKTLKSICSTFKSGNGITAEEIQDSGVYPVYGGNGLRGYTDRFTHEGEFVLIGRQGALCGNINRASGKSYISEHAIAVAGNHLASTDWLEHRLTHMKLNRLSESSAQPGLAVNKLEKLKLLVPSLPEQTKIAGILSAMDGKIAAVGEQMRQTQAWKKGLLQQMFV